MVFSQNKEQWKGNCWKFYSSKNKKSFVFSEKTAQPPARARKKIPVGSICLEWFAFWVFPKTFLISDFKLQTHIDDKPSKPRNHPFSCIFWMLPPWDHPSILGSQPHIHDFSRMKLQQKNGSTLARSCMDACRR